MFNNDVIRTLQDTTNVMIAGLYDKIEKITILELFIIIFSFIAAVFSASAYIEANKTKKIAMETNQIFKRMAERNYRA